MHYLYASGTAALRPRASTALRMPAYPASDASFEGREETQMIYEMRNYRCLPGRLPALLKRFQDHTLNLWERHGIQQAGFWTYAVGPSNNELVYLIAWESMAERDRKWTAFTTDSDWIAARNASEADGPILANVANSFLQPTAFSAVK